MQLLSLTYMVVSVLLMSDSVIAGAVVGPDAVAGVTLVTPLYSLAAFFGSIISLGVLMSIAVGVVLFRLTCLFGEAYLRSCNPSEVVLEQARGYLFFMRVTILLLPMQTLLGAAVYSDGDETVSTIATAAQGAGNIAFSILLSHFMGIRGIGLASFLFNTVSMLILLTHFRKESNSLRWNLYFSFDILKQVVRFSIIDSSSYLFLAILTAALNAFVSGQYGPKFLILVSVITLTRELQLLFEGIGEAVGPILSVYVGEENHGGLKAIYKLASRSAVIEGIAVTAVLALIAPLVPRVLNVTDPELARWVVLGMRLTALGSTFMSLLYLITSYYLVIDQIILGTVACALRDLLLSASLGIILGKAFGVTGMFAGLAAAPVGLEAVEAAVLRAEPDAAFRVGHDAADDRTDH